MNDSDGIVAVVGGGISGLAAAWHLECAGRRVCVLEAGPRWGGVVASENRDGFLLEHGPDSYLTRKPATARLCAELGLEGEQRTCLAGGGRTAILWRGRLRPLPKGWQMLTPAGAASVLRSSLFSPRAKAELLWRSLRPAAAAAGEETVGEFLRRHFGGRAGGEIVDRVAAPLLAGVYGGEVEQLSLSAVLPRFAALEAEGNLARAARRAVRHTPAATPLFTTLRGGMGSLIAALVGALEADGRAQLRLNHPVRALRPRGAGFEIEGVDGSLTPAAAVVLALPAWAAAPMVADFDAPLHAVLAAIPYTSAATVNLAYERAPTLPPGYGFLAPRAPGRSLLACTFVHQKFAGRAPAGAGLLRVFLGGESLRASAPTSDAELTATARAEIAGILGVTAAPDLVRVSRWPRAMPQYTRGHTARVAAAHAILARWPGLALAGNAYQGVGLSDCIESGCAAAQRLAAAQGAR